MLDTTYHGIVVTASTTAGHTTEYVEEDKAEEVDGNDTYWQTCSVRSVTNMQTIQLVIFYFQQFSIKNFKKMIAANNPSL